MHSKHDFTQIYSKYYQPILGFIRARVGDTGVAEDLTGEVFYKAWRGRHGFRAGTSVKAWLFTIARNTLIDYWRRKKEVPLNSYEEGRIESELPALETAVEQEEEVWELTKALDSLVGNMKSVAILRFIEGLSAKEVAAILEMSEGNVRTTQFRALAKLREYMKNV